MRITLVDVEKKNYTIKKRMEPLDNRFQKCIVLVKLSMAKQRWSVEELAKIEHTLC